MAKSDRKYIAGSWCPRMTTTRRLAAILAADVARHNEHQLLTSPLNELPRSKPSFVMSRYSTSAEYFGSTQFVFGARIGFASLDCGVVSGSSVRRISADVL